jgi:hypothetical protein
MTHECIQERRLIETEAVADRVEKEIYVGREGRQPVLVRVDRCERIVNALTYVSTALLISLLVAAGSLLWQALKTYSLNR